jgi:hypothetical protein
MGHSITGRCIATLALALAFGACSGAAAPSTAPAVTAPAAAATVAPTPASARPSPTASPLDLAATLTYDGKACTWTGLTDVPRGAHLTISLINTPAGLADHGGAMFAFMVVRDGTTLQQVEAGAKLNAPDYVPDFVNLTDFKGPIMPQDAAAGTTLTQTLSFNQYLAMCFVAVSDTQVANHVGAMVYVHDR